MKKPGAMWPGVVDLGLMGSGCSVVWVVAHAELGRAAGSYGIEKVLEHTKAYPVLRPAYLGPPSILAGVPSDTNNAGRVRDVHLDVLGIFLPRHHPQVFNAIVCAVVVDVVDLADREAAMYESPSNAMRTELPSTEHGPSIAFAVNTTDRLPGFDAFMTVPVEKLTGFWVEGVRGLHHGESFGVFTDSLNRNLRSLHLPP
jgi:hypothetical protein